MEVVQPNCKIADHLENIEKNKIQSQYFDKTVVDLLDKSDIAKEMEYTETNEVQSDSFELTLQQSSDENDPGVTNISQTVEHSIETNLIDKISENQTGLNKLNVEHSILTNSLDKISENQTGSNELNVSSKTGLSDSELQHSPIKITHKKSKLFIKSDSESENKKDTVRKPFKLIDSESDISIHDNKSPLKQNPNDSDVESHNSSESVNITSRKKVKKLKKRKDHKTTNSAPLDSDDETELDHKQLDDIERVDEKEMIAIKSESQRTIREHMVEVPCHKPRTFTLKEFLERKTVLKPTALIKQQVKTFKSNENIKMNREELKVFAKKIEQRKRDIRSFFQNQTKDKQINRKIETLSTKSAEKVDSSMKPAIEMEVSNCEEINKENVIHELNTVEVNNVTEPESETNKQEIALETKIIKQDKIAKLSNMKSEVRLSFNYDENSFIDLDSGSVVNKKIETKAEQFMNRVLKHINAGKKKKSTDDNEELKRLIDCDEEYKMDIKPRGSYIKLKKQLEERIMEEKKLKFKLQEKERNDKEDEDEEEMEEYNEKLDEVEEKEEQDDVFDEDEETAELDDDDENENDFEDEEVAEELNCEEKSKLVSDIDGEESDEEGATKTFSRIKPLVDDLDSSDNENNQDICENQLELLDDDKLFNEDITDGRDVEDELLGLCSGRFDSQLPTSHQLTLSSQAPTTCENMPSISLSSVAKDTNDESSHDEDDIKVGTKKVRKTRKIVLSDDEDDKLVEPTNQTDNEEELESDAQPNMYNDEEEEMIITYDSDENDIALTVEDYEKTKKMKIKNFIENEAELSESDWNSEDEDERGADNYDIELGDEDKFDAQKLKTELAQIHMRRMLNDDEREVQMIQDLIMPDQEENEVRERKFRWTNLDNPLVDGPQSVENPDPNENHSEDESEEYYRKLRFERETLLQSQPDELEPTNLLIKTDSQELDKTKPITKRISIIKTERNKTPVLSTDTSFLIGSKNSPLITKFRDSFLARGEQHLSSLELLTIEKLEKCATIETAITTEKSAKLFFVIDDEAKAKRKSEETLESTVKRKKVS